MIFIGYLGSILIATTQLYAEPNASLFGQEQSLRVHTYTLEDGLPGLGVTAILQDQLGFLWLATRNGVVKWDGYTFQTFKPELGDSLSISDRHIEALHESRDGGIWVGTHNGGLNYFDRKTEHFTRYLPESQDVRSLSGKFVTSIYEDTTGALWVGTDDNGLNRLETATGTFTHFKHDPQNSTSLSHNSISTIFEDRSGVIWIGTKAGLARMTRAPAGAETFTTFKSDSNNPNSVKNNWVTAIAEDTKGRMWIGTLGGLHRVEPQTGIFRAYNNPGYEDIETLCEDQFAKLWIASHGGVSVFDPTKEEFINYEVNNLDQNNIGYGATAAIYEDRAGILWLGTKEFGLKKLDRSRQKFPHYKHDPQIPYSLSNNFVWCFLEDRSGVLWVGTQGGGLNQLMQEPGTFVHYNQARDNPDSFVNVLYEDRAGMLWLGTRGGLSKYNRKTKVFTRYNKKRRDFTKQNEDWVRAIHEDDAGVLWIGTHGGLKKFDRETGDFKAYLHNPADPQSLSADLVWSIYEDKSGVLWIGTARGGLNKFDRKTETCTRYFKNQFISSIYEDSRGRFWLGIMQMGLILFDRSTGSSTTFSTKDGLPSDMITRIVEDDNGELWISMVGGLSKFNPDARTFRNYDVSDGLLDKGGNIYKGQTSGRMFFASHGNGFNVFFPDSVKDNPYSPQLVLTDLKLFNQSVSTGADSPLPNHISVTSEIQLSYWQNDLSLEFAALHFSDPAKNTYSYILQNYEETWRDVGTQRMATYTNLDPGKYVFRVKGANSDGIWDVEGASLKITITAPPWKTWWAYMLYVIFVSAAFYGLRAYELNRMRLKQDLEQEQVQAEKLQELDRMKSDFFANISHEFRTPLTLIIGPLKSLLSGDFIGDIKKQYRLMIRNSERLLRLINQLLDLSKLEAGKLRLEASPGDIIKSVKAIVLSFQSLADSRNITLRIEAPKEPLEIYFDQDKLEKIFYNLLSNAFKFTPAQGEISVSVRQSSPESQGADVADFIEIVVQDSGSGIPVERIEKIFDRFYQVDSSQTREKEGTGIGLALTKELVDLHHGEISVRSESGKGAQFTVRLPAGKSHLSSDEITETGVRSYDPEPLPDIDLQLENETLPEQEVETSANENVPLILIVEDNAEVRTYIRENLADEYRVNEAADGMAGFEQAVTAIPDLIISDVMMPKMDGFELCEKLKHDEKTSHIPVILLTARASGDSKLEGLETGADDYLTKPFDARELRVRVKNLIEQRQKLRERWSREVTLQPQEIAITPMDEVFLNRVLAVLEENIEDEEFTVEDLGRQVGMSRTQLHRKLRALVDQSASQFIRTFKLQRAMEMLKQKAGTISEIAYAVGFSSLTYFTKCFHDQFGFVPSHLKKQNN